MRILVAHAYYRLRGGEDRYVDEQVELLARSHSVELYAVRNDQLSTAKAAEAMFRGAREKQAFDTTVRKFKPDVIHLHNAYPALGPTVQKAAAHHGIPLVMTLHNYRLRCPNGLTFTEGAHCERCVGGNHANAVLHRCFESRTQALSYATALWMHRFISRTETKVTLFITPSDFVGGKLMEWGITTPSRTVRSFTRPFLDADATPGAYGMFLGRLSAEKGVDVLLNALRLAGDPPFKIVGSGPRFEDLVALRNRLGLMRTEFVGRLSTGALDRLLRQARYVAMPSLWNETGGLAAMEAMAAGRPILVSDRGALPELVTGSEGGHVVEAGRADELADKIRLLKDDERCREMGFKGLTYARRYLTPEAHLTAMDEVYDSLLSVRL